MKKYVLRLISYISIFMILISTITVYADSNTTIINNKKEVNYSVKEENLENKIIIDNVLEKDLVKDTSGDNFFLNHNINGEYDGLGIPFIDYRTDFNTKKTIIYAHSNKDGTGPFQELQNYHNNKDYYLNNPYITIQYDNNIYKYQIFSVYVSIADNEESEGLEYYRKLTYTTKSWEETLNKYKNNSEYETNIEVDKNTKILILQTCSMDDNYFEKYYRYNLLIMAKLI